MWSTVICFSNKVTSLFAMVDRSAEHLCREHKTQIRDCRLHIELAYFVAHTCRLGTQAASFLCTSGFNIEQQHIHDNHATSGMDYLSIDSCS